MLMNRDPLGKFIDQGAMLYAWLPKFLDWTRGDAMVTALELMAHECLKQAAKHLKWRAAELEEQRNLESDWQFRLHEKQLKRREILMRAAKELKEIGN